MGSITKYIDVAAPANAVWDAVRDFGALHERLVPGFVVGSTLEGDDGSDRVITFVSGAVAELPRSGSRIEWTTDFLPDALGSTLDAMMEQGVLAMGRSFGTVSAPTGG